MKLPEPDSLRNAGTAAPALERGLALWTLLLQASSLTLEQVATRLSLPKTSALRLLESLCRLGVVRRLPDKRYEALWGIHVLSDPVEQLRQALDEPMEALCRESRCTVEWYEPSPEGMTLVLQKLPDTEVRVQARPGYLRTWGGELEAVTTLALALVEGAPAPSHMPRYKANGVVTTISPRQMLPILESAQTTGAAVDPAFNCNGVRRCAVAAVAEGRVRGVLALAEVFRFDLTHGPERWIEPLFQTLPPRSYPYENPLHRHRRPSS